MTMVPNIDSTEYLEPSRLNPNAPCMQPKSNPTGTDENPNSAGYVDVVSITHKEKSRDGKPHSSFSTNRSMADHSKYDSRHRHEKDKKNRHKKGKSYPHWRENAETSLSRSHPFRDERAFVNDGFVATSSTYQGDRDGFGVSAPRSVSVTNPRRLQRYSFD